MRIKIISHNPPDCPATNISRFIGKEYEALQIDHDAVHVDLVGNGRQHAIFNSEYEIVNGYN